MLYILVVFYYRSFINDIYIYYKLNKFLNHFYKYRYDTINYKIL